MKSVSVRELLRNHEHFVSIVESGETVMVTKRDKPIYRMSPIKKKRGAAPDILGRLKAIYGDKVISREAMAEVHQLNKGKE